MYIKGMLTKPIIHLIIKIPKIRGRIGWTPKNAIVVKIIESKAIEGREENAFLIHKCFPEVNRLNQEKR